MLQRRRVLIGRLEREVALGADDAVLGRVGGAEAAQEARQALTGKAQHRAHRLLDLAGAPRRHRAYLDRLVAEQPARGVDAVDADVVERAAAQGALEANVPGHHLHREGGIEKPRLADAPGARDFDRLQVGALEVQAIGDHQLHARAARRLGHALALLLGERHRLLHQHVDACLRGADRVLGVQAVG